MKRNALFGHFHIFQGPFYFLVRFITYFVVLTMLSSCTEGSKRGTQFQPESMHWLQFRGPEASGIAPEDADPPIHFSADTNLLWKTSILPGWSSPCIVNERIFLTGYNKKDSLVHTFAVNRENGEILWKDSVKMWWVYDLHPANSYANPTIASDGKRIYVHHPARGVICYDLDGSKCWDYLHWGLTFKMASSSSPLLKDSLLLVTLNHSGNPRIVMLDCATGDSIGVIRNPEHMQSFAGRASTPVLHGDLLILHQFGKVAAYNINTSEAVWWLKTPTAGVSTPVVTGDMVYLGTFTQFGEKGLNKFQYDFDDLLAAYDLNQNQELEQSEIPDSLMVYERTDAVDEFEMNMALNDDSFIKYFDKNNDQALDRGEWEASIELAKQYYHHGMMAIPITGRGELSAADLLWRVEDNSPETPSPLVAGNHVFYIKNGGIMTVIDKESGEVEKLDRIGAAGVYLSSPLLAGNRIYTCSYNGTITVLSAVDFSVLAHNKLKEKIGASPVAVDDVLYIRTDKHLYAFREI